MIELERVKKLAKKNKITLKEINDRAGLGKNTIYNWKKKRPGGDALEAVASVLHTSMDYLKGITDNPAPIDKKASAIPLDENTLYSYHGYNIPDDYLNIIRNLMERDIKQGHADKNGDHQSK